MERQVVIIATQKQTGEQVYLTGSGEWSTDRTKAAVLTGSQGDLVLRIVEKFDDTVSPVSLFPANE